MPTTTQSRLRSLGAHHLRRAHAAGDDEVVAEVAEVADALSGLLDSPLAPLHEAYVGGEVAWEEWAGYKTATYLGDVGEELKRVRTGAVMFDMSPVVKYRIVGPDACNGLLGLSLLEPHGDKLLDGLIVAPRAGGPEQPPQGAATTTSHARPRRRCCHPLGGARVGEILPALHGAPATIACAASVPRPPRRHVARYSCSSHMGARARALSTALLELVAADRACLPVCLSACLCLPACLPASLSAWVSWRVQQRRERVAALLTEPDGELRSVSTRGPVARGSSCRRHVLRIDLFFNKLRRL